MRPRRPEGSTRSRPRGARRSWLVTLDRSLLTERVGRVSAKQLDLVLACFDTVLGR